LLLLRLTTAPSFIAPVNVTLPVLFAVPTMVAGVAETAFSVGS
jgi:hypothetical protein